MAVLDATGLFHLGDIEQRSDGRVQGAVGESNQYGAFVALSLPAIVALVTITRGVWRVFWMAASVITAAALVMTVSRGAFVATMFATVFGVWLFRRYLPARSSWRWAAWGSLGAVLAGVLVMSLGFGDLIYQRIVIRAAVDITSTSSGRTEIWTTVLEVMFDKPLTLLTGFGWEAYPHVSLPLGHAQSLSGAVLQSRIARAGLQRAAPDRADPRREQGSDFRSSRRAAGADRVRHGHDRARDRRVLRESVLALALLLVVCRHRHAPRGECTGTAGVCA